MKSLISIAGLVSALLCFAVYERVAALTSMENQQVLSLYRVSQPSETALQRISEEFEIEHRHGNDFEVVVPADKLASFKEIAPKAVLLEADMRATVLATLDSYEAEAIETYRYRELSEVQQILRTLENERPEIAQVVQYGTTPDGHPLLALKLSDNVTDDEDEPEVMLTAATHGDELITTEVSLELIRQLVEGYGVNERLSTLVNEREIYFIPVVNPDGFVRRARYDQGNDPNRSYPYPGRDTVESTPSIKALIAFFHSRQFKASIDFHAYGGLVMYPWAYTYNDLPPQDVARFDPIAKQMAATNGYRYGQIAETIYIAKGSSSDYYYWKTGLTALAIEVGTSKVPHPRDFPRYFDEQLESTWLFLESAKPYFSAE